MLHLPLKLSVISSNRGEDMHCLQSLLRNLLDFSELVVYEEVRYDCVDYVDIKDQLSPGDGQLSDNSSHSHS